MKELETLYRNHASAVFRFAWGLCGDRSLAEDLVSETFVRVIIRAPRLETRTVLAYLLAIARNLYLSGLRRRKREVPLTEDLPEPVLPTVDSLGREERLTTMLQALGGLPEGERSALLLRVDQELSYEEIAAALGISVGAAKVRVHRARMRLSSVLEARGGHHEV